jgi:hypothetical protein
MEEKININLARYSTKKFFYVWLILAFILTLVSLYNFARFASSYAYPFGGIFPYEVINTPREWILFLSIYIPLILIALELLLLAICFVLSALMEYAKRFFTRNYLAFSTRSVTNLALIFTILVNLFFEIEAILSMF